MRNILVGQFSLGLEVRRYATQPGAENHGDIRSRGQILADKLSRLDDIVPQMVQVYETSLFLRVSMLSTGLGSIPFKSAK